MPLSPLPHPFSAGTALQHYSWCAGSHSLPRDLPSSSIHVGYLLHCLVHNPRTVAYYTYSPGIDAIDQISSIEFELHNFLTLLIYSGVILPFILVLRVWSNCKMPSYLSPFSSISPICWLSGSSIPLLPTCHPLLISRTAHLSSPKDILISCEKILTN